MHNGRYAKLLPSDTLSDRRRRAGSGVQPARREDGYIVRNKIGLSGELAGRSDWSGNYSRRAGHRSAAPRPKGEIRPLGTDFRRFGGWAADIVYLLFDG